MVDGSYDIHLVDHALPLLTCLKWTSLAYCNKVQKFTVIDEWSIWESLFPNVYSCIVILLWEKLINDVGSILQNDALLEALAEDQTDRTLDLFLFWKQEKWQWPTKKVFCEYVELGQDTRMLVEMSSSLPSLRKYEALAR